jgi:thioesterase domain-containing protein/acyl carrier protein
VLPASVAQQSFWYLDQLDPGNPAYNIALRFMLRGPLDRRALASAFEQLCRRHETLRTKFVEVDGEPVQVVSPAQPFEIPFIDLGGLDAPRRESRAEELTIEEGRRRFDLAAGPLLRAILVRLETEVHLLLITVHHIVADGWSTGILISEIATLYGTCHRGLPSPLAELPLQYGDYAIWQEQCLRENALAEQLEFWKRTLDGHRASTVPTDRPRPAMATSSGGMEAVLLPKELTDRLSDLAHREGVTFFMLCLAALKVLLQRLTDQSDVCVGTPISGRSRVELEALIGVFINPVALRTDLSGDPSFLELLARVRDTTLDAFANQDIPFERVVETVHRHREADRHPIFQVNLIHQRAFLKPVEVEGLSIRAEPSITPGALYDMNFIMVERAEGWRLSCEYNTDLFDAEPIRQTLAHLETILDGVASDPARRLSHLPALWNPHRPTSLAPIPATIPSPAPAPSLYRLTTAAEPAGEVETKLLRIWEDLLGIDRIAITDDFFDVGGHSLLAARLLSRVEKAFSVRIPILAFVKQPTIRALADRLRSTLKQDWLDQVIHFRSGGSKPQLIIINPFHRYSEVMKYLGPDQPVVGIASPSARDMPPHFSVELLADRFLEILPKVQPHGPYYLAGWCNTGIVAYEVAQRLRSRGEEIGQLTLIDSWSPNLRRRLRTLSGLRTRIRLRLHKLRWHARRVRSMGFPEGFHYLASRLRANSRRIGGREDAGDARLRVDGQLVENGEIGHLLAHKYKPTSFDSKILLITTDPLGDCKAVRYQGWDEVARGGLEIRHLACDHENIFKEPNVRDLARILSECIPEVSSTDTLGRRDTPVPPSSSSSLHAGVTGHQAYLNR